MLDDRGQVDVLDVARPGDHPWVEAERCLVGGVEALEELQRPVDAKTRLGLTVGPVELDIAEGAFGLGPSLFDTRGTFCSLTSNGK